MRSTERRRRASGRRADADQHDRPRRPLADPAAGRAGPELHGPDEGRPAEAEHGGDADGDGACTTRRGKPPRPPSRLGALDGDLCGFPNGRRLADDIVDIELRAFAQGYGPFLNAAFGLPNKSPNNQLGDGVDANDKAFLDTFPYVAAPNGATTFRNRNDPGPAAGRPGALTGGDVTRRRLEVGSGSGGSRRRRPAPRRRPPQARGGKPASALRRRRGGESLQTGLRRGGDTAGLIERLQSVLRAARRMRARSICSASRTSSVRAKRATRPTTPSPKGCSSARWRYAPNDLLATSGLGSLALSRHRFREALALGRRARSISPTTARNYGVIGDALVELGRYPRGLPRVRQAGELDARASLHTPVSRTHASCSVTSRERSRP